MFWLNVGGCKIVSQSLKLSRLLGLSDLTSFQQPSSFYGSEI